MMARIITAHRPDHPRVCGEKIVQVFYGCSTPGSPPRMRGKDFDGNHIVGQLGITPAYAGKSLWGGSVRVRIWDHPRVCGEKRTGKIAVCWA